jgi:hypothetical protein
MQAWAGAELQLLSLVGEDSSAAWDFAKLERVVAEASKVTAVGGLAALFTLSM